jgi:hypothetical protein
MVQLIPACAAANANANPTRSEIDAYIHGSYGSAAAAADAETLRSIVREIECKSGAGALLHPAEEYFAAAAVAAAANYSIVLSCKER